MAAAPLLEKRIDKEVPDVERLGSLHDEYAAALPPAVRSVPQGHVEQRNYRSWLCMSFCGLTAGACCSALLWEVLCTIYPFTFNGCDAGIAMGCDASGFNNGIPCTQGLPLCDLPQDGIIMAQMRTNDPYSIGVLGYVGVGLSPLAYVYGRTALTFLKTGASEVYRGIAGALR